MPHSAWLHGATNPSGSAFCQDLLPCGLPSGSPWPDDGSPSGPLKTDEHAEEGGQTAEALLDARRGISFAYLGDARNNVGNSVGAEIYERTGLDSLEVTYL